uniref:Glycogen [starch] synthase n=1 Tax=Timema genevievae TaxID=629358 RepID=A0A7R9K086_TIMGE|nr:unnamed protein product [Timema genevievae]
MSRERASRRFYRVESQHDLLSHMDKGQLASLENRWSFEAAWEVANKVGGIYTVIRSKTYVSTEEMGEQYCLLGPYKEQCARIEVEEAEFPPENPLSIAVNKMRQQGFKIHTGTWLVDGNPQVILFDIGSAAWKLDEYKQELWSTCSLGIPHLDIEANDAVILGYQMAHFIAEFRKAAEEYSESPPRIVAHFHEWQAGLGLIALRTRHVDVATVFTTHATLLGRYRLILDTVLPELLEDIPLLVQHRILHQCDSVPIHNGAQVWQLLNEVSSNQWIRHGGAGGMATRPCTTQFFLLVGSPQSIGVPT